MIDRRLLCAAVVAFALAPNALRADLAGHWEGAIEIPGSKLDVQLDVSRDNGALKGKVTIPAQNVRDLPLINISGAGPKVSFEINGIHGNPTFTGDLAGDAIAGSFTQGKLSFPFRLVRAVPPEESAREALSGYDVMVERMIADWKVPGLAVAVVQGEEIVHLKGYGWRDAGQKLRVTPKTLFAVGSTTKAFTTLLLGTLVDEGKLSWDQPVRELLPGFRLWDPAATELLTPRDMVTHRSGLPRHDLLWYNNGAFSRREMVERLRYLPPNEPLRAKWQYNNLMYLSAGYLVEVLTGKSWEDNVRERIFEPLGMTQSNFSVLDSQQSPDFAQPYREENEKVVQIPFRDITNVGPAGSINSSAADMARWIQLHLAHGKAGDRQLVGVATLADIHTGHMILEGAPERKEISQAAYGLGWMVDTYRGHLRVYHGGNIDGFSALVTLFPQDGLGLVILVNKHGSELPELLARHTADRLLKLDPIDWNGEALGKLELGQKAEKDAEAKKTTRKKPGTRPAHPLAEYQGLYEHPGYGVAKVDVAGDRLELTFNAIQAPFEHWHYEVWAGAKGGPDPTLEGARIQFRDDLDGNVSGLAAQIEPQVEPILFKKKPDERLFDPAYLADLAGAYELAGQTIILSLAGNALTAAIPGQPIYHLEPNVAGSFVLKEIPAFSITFVQDAQGAVSGINVNQPDGVYFAARKK